MDQSNGAHSLMCLLSVKVATLLEHFIGLKGKLVREAEGHKLCVIDFDHHLFGNYYFFFCFTVSFTTIKKKSYVFKA